MVNHNQSPLITIDIDYEALIILLIIITMVFNHTWCICCFAQAMCVDMTSKFLENVPVVKSRPNGTPRSGHANMKVGGFYNLKKW